MVIPIRDGYKRKKELVVIHGVVFMAFPLRVLEEHDCALGERSPLSVADLDFQLTLQKQHELPRRRRVPVVSDHSRWNDNKLRMDRRDRRRGAHWRKVSRYRDERQQDFDVREVRLAARVGKNVRHQHDVRLHFVETIILTDIPRVSGGREASIALLGMFANGNPAMRRRRRSKLPID